MPSAIGVTAWASPGQSPRPIQARRHIERMLGTLRRRRHSVYSADLCRYLNSGVLVLVPGWAGAVDRDGARTPFVEAIIPVRPGRIIIRPGVVFMAKFKIAWLPGDGIGVDVMEAAKIVLDRIGLDAEYIHGDIGWEFWRAEGDAFPARTIDLLRHVDAAMFGAITSKPQKAAEAELAEPFRGKGLQYRSPVVRMRQLFDLYID